MTYQLRRVAALLMFILVAPVGSQTAIGAQADPWAEAMAEFEQQDRKTPPPKGGIVFVGSSSIRGWDLSRSFPDLPVINRGFGGSEIIDSVNHVDLLVLRHQPRTVVFYAGDNDLAAGKTPKQVARDFKTFVARVHAALPATRVAFIGIKPSLLRWKLIGKGRQANALIRTYCERDDRLVFIDVDGPMLGWDEKPRKELLAADGLHLTPRGYELWTVLVRPLLDQP